ncbi:MAG: hypothetical protein IPM18_14340 [Phycisphaerales bacterium]|nr:hypothetical protein [Phycisphaerales bacterium]
MSAIHANHAGVLLHAGALGDLVLALHLVECVGAQFAPHLTWDVVSRVDPGDLATVLPGVRRRPLETLGSEWLYRTDAGAPPGALVAQIAGRRVLSMLGGPRTDVSARLRLLSPATLWAVDPRPKLGERRHIVAQWWDQLTEQALAGEFPWPVCLPQADALSVRQRSAAAAEGPILLHPGSGGRAKCWPLSCFVETATHLDAQRIPVVFLLGPAEVERWGSETCAVLTQKFVSHCEPSPAELTRLLCCARGYVGNDAGPTHLAAYLGTPTVAIFGPTEPDIWAPWGPRVTVLRGEPQAPQACWGLSVPAVSQAAITVTRKLD